MEEKYVASMSAEWGFFQLRPGIVDTALALGEEQLPELQPEPSSSSSLGIPPSRQRRGLSNREFPGQVRVRPRGIPMLLHDLAPAAPRT